MIGLLDRFSDRPGVVTGLRALRERTPDPPGPPEYLVPHTYEQALAGLSGSIELLLRTVAADPTTSTPAAESPTRPATDEAAS